MNFRILIVINLFSYFLIKADCSDLSYEDCLYWSGFCVWDEESGICQDVDGGGGDNDPGGEGAGGVLHTGDISNTWKKLRSIKHVRMIAQCLHNYKTCPQ